MDNDQKDSGRDDVQIAPEKGGQRTSSDPLEKQRRKSQPFTRKLRKWLDQLSKGCGEAEELVLRATLIGFKIAVIAAFSIWAVSAVAKKLIEAFAL